MSLLRKALLVNSSEIASLILGLGQSILLARFLGPSGIGQYAVIVSAMSVSAQLFSLGLPISFLYHSQREPADRTTLLMNTVWAGLLPTLSGGAALAITVAALPRYFGVVTWFGLVAIGLYLPIVLARVVARNVLLVEIEARRLALLSLTSTAGGIFAILVLWLFGSFNVSLAVVCFVIAPVVGTLVACRWVRVHFDTSVRPTWMVSRRILAMGIRQSWADLAVLVDAQLSIMLVRYLMGDFESVGYFSRAQSVSLMVVAAGQAVLPLLFSRWASISAARLSSHVERVMRFISTAGLFAITIVLLTGRRLIVGMYGEAFLPAVEPMLIMVPGAVLYLLSRALMQLLGSQGIPEVSAMVLLCGSAMCAGLTWLLIPSMGIAGAAWAATLGDLVQLMLLFLIVKNKFDVRILECWWMRSNDIRIAMESVS
jgi:O-antigen/teichoic acid export membrane protein